MISQEDYDVITKLDSGSTEIRAKFIIDHPNQVCFVVMLQFNCAISVGQLKRCHAAQLLGLIYYVAVCEDFSKPNGQYSKRPDGAIHSDNDGRHASGILSAIYLNQLF